MYSGNESRPQYGRRLLPCVLDDEAQTYPERLFAAFATSNNVCQGFRDVTFSQMAHAVDFMAHRLQSTFGSILKHDFETLTYIGVPDLRYNIVFYAAVKCGYKVVSLVVMSLTIFLLSQKRSFYPRLGTL